MADVLIGTRDGLHRVDSPAAPLLAGHRIDDLGRGTDLAGGVELTRCEEGLPPRFSTNIETGCLAAVEGLAAIGDVAGTVFASADKGESWEVVADGLPAVTCVAIG